MPKIDLNIIEENNSTGYPSPYNQVVAGRFRKALGDAVGLTQFGVNLTKLLPGAASAHRHWHEKEDEFLYIVHGELILVEDQGETILRAGDAAGFKAGVRNGHHLINRSKETSVYLEIGTRSLVDVSTYTDPAVDMKFIKQGGSWTAVRKDGSSY